MATSPTKWRIAVCLLSCAILTACSGDMKKRKDIMMEESTDKMIRTALGSGRWFPSDPNELRAMTDSFINKASVPSGTGNIIAALSPHAGYVYSGAVAGHTFRALKEASAAHGAPETLVIAGFSHSTSFRGVALMDGTSIVTPLGETPIDRDANAILSGKSDLIYEDYTPHRGEHSAENQIPFVQAALPQSKLVVALMGDHDMRSVEAFVEALTELSARRRIVFIASTDLLHDPDYNKVSRTDKASLDLIAGLNTEKLASQWSYDNQVCCGIMPVLTAMLFARKSGATEGQILHYRNSGDDFPESRGNWVVGYGAVIFSKK